MPIPRKLPNTDITLVFGIISILSFFCLPVIGGIFGVIAIAISQNSVRLYKQAPTEYHGFQTLQAGRITAMIGVGIAVLTFIFGLILSIIRGQGSGFDGFDIWHRF